MLDVVYTILQPEFAEAYQLWSARETKKLPGRTLLIAANCVLAGFFLWSLFYLPFWLSIAFYLSVVAFFAICHWRKSAIRTYQFSQSAHKLEEIHVRIDETGYRGESHLSEGWLAWKGFSGWRETSGVFVLGKNFNFYTVPKRALSAEQQNELRTLLQEQLGPAS